jgi:Arc/MetJ-type ribon-helix-helix transcriptional regulator
METKSPAAPKRKRQNMIMTSIRLHENTLKFMRDMARKRDVPYSEVIRSALLRLEKESQLQGSLRMAVVDTEMDNRVIEFPIYE